MDTSAHMARPPIFTRWRLAIAIPAAASGQPPWRHIRHSVVRVKYMYTEAIMCICVAIVYTTTSLSRSHIVFLRLAIFPRLAKSPQHEREMWKFVRVCPYHTDRHPPSATSFTSILCRSSALTRDNEIYWGRAHEP